MEQIKPYCDYFHCDTPGTEICVGKCDNCVLKGCRGCKHLFECVAEHAWNEDAPKRIVEKLEALREAEYDDSDEEPVYNDFDDIFDEGVSSGKFKAYHKAIEIVKEEMS